jgi:hypothetical protein
MYLPTKNLEGKAKAINAVHAAGNELAPLLVLRLAEGYKLKDDRRLYKKDRDALNDIIKARNNEGLHIYIDENGYSICLRIKAHYTDDPGKEYSSTSYINDYIYLANVSENEIHEPEPREMITADEMRAKESEIMDIDAKIRELETRKSGLKLKLYL